jgi:hypothetical protein
VPAFAAWPAPQPRQAPPATLAQTQYYSAAERVRRVETAFKRVVFYDIQHVKGVWGKIDFVRLWGFVMSAISSRTLSKFGEGAFILAIAWWVIFFLGFIAKTGSKPDEVWGHAVQCFVYTTQPCAIAYGLAEFAGYPAYKPELVWFAIVLMVAGRVIKNGEIEGEIQITPSVSPLTETVKLDVHSSKTYDESKWRALLQYDEQLAAVAQKLQVLGPKWVDELASAYLAINDKSYLPAIVNKIIADAKRERESHFSAGMRP